MKRGWVTAGAVAVTLCASVIAGQARVGHRMLAIPKADGGSELCEAKINVRVAALQDSTSFLSAGSASPGLTQYWSTPDHIDSFCFHGGYCYPAHVKRAGKLVAVMTPRKCRIDMSKGERDSDGVLHGLVLIRSQVSASDLARNDLEAFLESKGMCSACAPGAADAFIKTPRSNCGRFVKRLIAGDPEAIRKAPNASECS